MGYIGSTPDVLWRLERHNMGWSRSTKSKRPWNIVYTEGYGTKRETLKREREIKRMKRNREVSLVPLIERSEIYGVGPAKTHPPEIGGWVFRFYGICFLIFSQYIITIITKEEVSYEKYEFSSVFHIYVSVFILQRRPARIVTGLQR
ncbi:MAG: GIY-YIG nuclease family protein [Bacteroidota bacterium]|nr:GIY-YIG nuclease family protein [Bacteroidota bacterium]